VDWESQAITVKSCGTTPNYQYYPDPCTFTIDAALDNSTNTNQTRNILFLWGDFGTGQFHWRFVDLQENVTIPSAGLTVTSKLWSSVPKMLPEHPCVRVYILPATLLSSFSKTDIETKFDTPGFTAADLETAYALGPPQWAQKNISVAPMGTICPVCAEASLFPSKIQSSVVSGLQTKEASLVPTGLFASIASFFSQIAGGQAPIGTIGPGKMPIYLSAREREQFQKANAFVQVRAVCSATPDPSRKKPAYEFLEDCGGLLKLVPTELLAKKGGIALTFGVTNSAKVPRTISLIVTTLSPTGNGTVPVSIDMTPHLVAPGETRTFLGTVNPGPCFHFPLSIGTALPPLFGGGLFMLGLIAYRRRNT
jgi:hypothetical protein